MHIGDKLFGSGAQDYESLADDDETFTSRPSRKEREGGSPRWVVVLLSVSVAVLLIAAVVELLMLVEVISIPKNSNDNNNNNSNTGRPIKNVIFMLGDGFGPAAVTLGRVTSNRTQLNLDPYVRGTIRTYSSNSVVTDSAAGATAYSCALKSYNGAIGVDPKGIPCGTIMEAAKQQHGMATGLVVTSRLTHATPASFSAHVTHRDEEFYIASQQLTQNIDVMFGGGRKEYTGDTRPDGVDLISEFKSLNYSILFNKTEFDANDYTTPVLGLFAKSHMDFEIDRDPTEQPSLPEMTSKALEMLDGLSENGFFVMIEGSRIDMAGHSNDPGAQWHEVVMFDDAFQVAIDFAEKNGETAVFVVADHETGGLALGRKFDNHTSLYTWDPEQLRRCSASVESQVSQIWDAIKDADLKQYLPIGDGSSISNTPTTTASGVTTVTDTNSGTEVTGGDTSEPATSTETTSAVTESGESVVTAVQNVIEEVLLATTGVKHFLPEEIAMFAVPYLDGTCDGHSCFYVQQLIADRVSYHAHIGYSTFGHTGVDINLYVFGDDTLKGNQNNIDVGAYVADILNADLQAVTDSLADLDPNPPAAWYPTDTTEEILARRGAREQARTSGEMVFGEDGSEQQRGVTWW